MGSITLGIAAGDPWAVTDYDGTGGHFGETPILSVGAQFFYVQICSLKTLLLGDFTKQLDGTCIWDTEEASFQ